MNDLQLMILSALGAVAGAIAILSIIGLGLAAITAATSSAATILIVAAPAVICIGGVAYAASNTGYGVRG